MSTCRTLALKQPCLCKQFICGVQEQALEAPPSGPDTSSRDVRCVLPSPPAAFACHYHLRSFVHPPGGCRWKLGLRCAAVTSKLWPLLSPGARMGAGRMGACRLLLASILLALSGLLVLLLSCLPHYYSLTKVTWRCLQPLPALTPRSTGEKKSPLSGVLASCLLIRAKRPQPTSSGQ